MFIFWKFNIKKIFNLYSIEATKSQILLYVNNKLTLFYMNLDLISIYYLIRTCLFVSNYHHRDVKRMSISNNWVYRTVSKTYRNGMNVTHIYLYVSYILLHVAIHYNSYVYLLRTSSFSFCINYITYYRPTLLAISPRNLQKTFSIVYYQNHIPS